MVRRPLNAEDAQLWRQVASTVRPITGRPAAQAAVVIGKVPVTSHAMRGVRAVPAQSRPVSNPRPVIAPGSLDGSWDKRLARGQISPDFTIDLHGETLQSAHHRLVLGIAHASAAGARIILLITGRPARDNPRLPPTRRGVIRASVIDWLSASDLSGRIAAIRPAHQRHGGHGALYLILKRVR